MVEIRPFRIAESMVEEMTSFVAMAHLELLAQQWQWKLDAWHSLIADAVSKH